MVYNAKTSITIIAAYEGLKAGLIGSELYSIITTVALVSAISSAMILRVLPTITPEDLTL